MKRSELVAGEVLWKHLSKEVQYQINRARAVIAGLVADAAATVLRTLRELDDTPDAYSEGKFLRSTASRYELADAIPPNEISPSVHVRVAVDSDAAVDGSDNPYDGQALATNDLALFFGKATASLNGVYRKTAGGMERWTDDAGRMRLVHVMKGTYAGRGFEMVTDDPITVGATALAFALLPGNDPRIGDLGDDAVPYYESASGQLVDSRIEHKPNGVTVYGPPDVAAVVTFAASSKDADDVDMGTIAILGDSASNDGVQGRTGSGIGVHGRSDDGGTAGRFDNEDAAHTGPALVANNPYGFGQELIGGFKVPQTDVFNTNLTVTEKHYYLRCRTNTAAIVLTLPTITAASVGMVLYVEDVAGNSATGARNITANTNGTQTFLGTGTTSEAMKTNFAIWTIRATHDGTNYRWSIRRDSNGV